VSGWFSLISAGTERATAESRANIVASDQFAFEAVPVRFSERQIARLWRSHITSQAGHEKSVRLEKRGPLSLGHHSAIKNGNDVLPASKVSQRMLGSEIR
jgi:hypothetical protein